MEEKIGRISHSHHHHRHHHQKKKYQYPIEEKRKVATPSLQYQQEQHGARRKRSSSTKPAGSDHGDWSEIHQPLLELILSRLHPVEFLKSGAVCRAWGSVQRQCRPPNSPLPPAAAVHQLPWAMVPRSNIGDEDRSFFSFTHHRFYHINRPEMRGKMCCASSHGWLLMVGTNRYDSERFLINPISGVRIQLPPRRLILDGGIPTEAIFTSVPTDPDCMVLVHHVNSFLFCRPGDAEWTVRRVEHHPFHFFFCSVISCKGKLFGIGHHRHFAVIDTIGRPTNVRLRFLEMDCSNLPRWTRDAKPQSHYLVESQGEVLLVILIYNKFPWEHEGRTIRFEVFRADLDNMVWVRKVEGLRDRVLFLGVGCSVSVSSSAAAGIEGRGNHIYFYENFSTFWEMFDFDLETGRVRACESAGSFNHYPWDNPMWMIPSLT